MVNSLARLEHASMALAQASDLSEVLEIKDIAQAAAEYARAAKLGLEAQNTAASIKLDAERKAGQMLSQLERGTGNQHTSAMSNVGHSRSPYTQVLTDTNTTRQEASRYQKIADLPAEVYEKKKVEILGSGKELTQAVMLRTAKALQQEKRRAKNKEKIESVEPLSIHASGTQYSTILIDPPWDWGDEGDISQFGRARPEYHTLSIDEIKALPVGKLAATNAHLYMWITNRSLPKGFGLLDAWGFRYITVITWCKPSFGMGNYFRGSSEHLLFAVKGSLPLLNKSTGTWFSAARGEGGHSSKPAEAYEIVEKCSPAPYLEMFSRVDRSGWVMWGEQGVK